MFLMKAPGLFHRAHLVKLNTISRATVPKRFSSKDNRVSRVTRSELDTKVSPLGQKIREGTKTFSYICIVLAGVGVTGGLIYMVLNELLSSKSPNNVFSKALKECLKNEHLCDKLGTPITAFGEKSLRGRRQHVTHALYVDNEGRNHMRMTFNLKGTAHYGTVNLDVVENDKGKYEYRYMFVQIDDMFKSVIVIEDNRNKNLTDV
ncbi:hypothetical protein ABEB36_006333 [Hypothenemus hampei]|uniref:Mitochondrial import inner membrane translocase subunit Tim21 n=1 Tax=Hypothenemus hampei TaxID=57062 RepID=A0ABD1EQ62_HYPHA